jgi:hypothetical protein
MSVAAAPEALLRVPIVLNPGRWTTSLIPLDKPLVLHEESGWQIRFVKASSGPAVANIIPATLPTDGLLHNDKALAAYVILPESGALKQYWVPVMERSCFAQLQTQGWTVYFQRDSL